MKIHVTGNKERVTNYIKNITCNSFSEKTLKELCEERLYIFESQYEIESVLYHSENDDYTVTLTSIEL